MGYLTKTLLFLAIGFSIVPVIGWSFTVEEYFSLAPELLSTLANIQLSLYTVCAASFVGFYFWSKNKSSTTCWYYVYFMGFNNNFV